MSDVNRWLPKQVPRLEHGVSWGKVSPKSALTGTIGIRRGGNVAMDTAGAGKGGIVGDACWVVLGNGGVPKFSRCAWDWESIVCW